MPTCAHTHAQGNRETKKNQFLSIFVSRVCGSHVAREEIYGHVYTVRTQQYTQDSEMWKRRPNSVNPIGSVTQRGLEHKGHPFLRCFLSSPLSHFCSRKLKLAGKAEEEESKGKFEFPPSRILGMSCEPFYAYVLYTILNVMSALTSQISS